MITNSFDNKSEAIINPVPKENRIKVDACIITFSHNIEEFVVKKYATSEDWSFMLFLPAEIFWMLLSGMSAAKTAKKAASTT